MQLRSSKFDFWDSFPTDAFCGETIIEEPVACRSITTPPSTLGINASGKIVGFYNDASGGHGFLYSGGTYTALRDDPLADQGTTVAYGINSSAATFLIPTPTRGETYDGWL